MLYSEWPKEMSWEVFPFFLTVGRYHFADKGPCSQSYGFSRSYVWMWELDHNEGWAPKICCLRTVVLDKTLESPLDCKEIKSVNPKEINPEYSQEGLLLRLKGQHFGHVILRADSLKRPWCWGRLKQMEKGVAEEEVIR